MHFCFAEIIRGKPCLVGQSFAKPKPKPLQSCFVGKSFRKPEPKPTSCPKCGRRYQFEHNLNKHMSTCGVQLRFPCNMCEKRFNRITDFKLHLFHKHGIRQ